MNRNIKINTTSSNSLLPFTILFVSASLLNNSDYEISKGSNYVSKNPPKVTQIFEQLPKQDLFIEGKTEILVDFVSKIVNESKDLDGRIVDMVNRNFSSLLLKI